MVHVIGYAANHAKAQLVPYSFERREPKEYDVLIDIKYCGICHTDIHQVNNEWGGSTYPMVPGHEIVGIVSKVGDKVTKYKTDDRVGVGCFVDSCRTCTPCKNGLEQYCKNGMVTTYNGVEKDGTLTQGGYSSKITVDENYILKIPDNIPLDRAAPLLCAGITLYSPLMHWKAGHGKKIAIIGLGGLGHMGVKIAHALGAEVSVLSHSLRKIHDGKKMGATHFYATSDPETFTKLQGYFDLIISTVSTDFDLNQFLNLLTLDGTMIQVGLPEKETTMNFASVIGNRRSLAGSLIGGIKETQEMLNFCSKNNISSDIEIIPIQQIDQAYKRILASDVRYRFVININSLL